jgi:hypothetical protein
MPGGTPRYSLGGDASLLTNFLSVLGEVISSHLGSSNLQCVFPGFDNTPAKFPHLLKA